jgi:hypothetical protein
MPTLLTNRANQLRATLDQGNVVCAPANPGNANQQVWCYHNVTPTAYIVE